MANSQSTRILIERIQGGDQEARNELYRRCQLPVLFLVRVSLGRRLRQKVDSWDIVQEALMKSLNDLQSFRYEREDAFRRYLSVKVQQVIRDHADYWSAEKRNPTREEPLARTNWQGGSDQLELADHREKRSPSDLVSLNEDLDRLAAALDQMSDDAPDVWEMIVEIKVIGRTLRDVADERNLTADAVKMRLRRGLVRLARIYRSLEK